MNRTYIQGNPPDSRSGRPGRSAPRLFQFLCVLTILGNLFLIVANLLKMGILDSGIRSGGVGVEASRYLTLLVQLVLLSCVGAIVGAIIMLRGKLLGYRIYMVSTVLHLVLTGCAMLLWAATIYLLFVSVLLFFYALIPLGFLLYFQRHRGHLA